MSTYHYFGIIAAATFMLTVLGLYYQLTLVLKRRRAFLSGAQKNDRPTSVLSLNQLNSIFLACYAFFIYGLCMSPTNHYLAWPRFIAMLILLLLFFQILIDRRSLLSALTLFISTFMLALTTLLFWYREDLQQYGKYAGEILVLIATLVLTQGYIHQILLIRRNGITGAVSIRFHQCVLLTAVSTIAFGFAIGTKDGWPLILLASASATLKVITLWHFRWVRLSKVAEVRRLNLNSNKDMGNFI